MYFSLAVPLVRLFTQQMHAIIAWGQRSRRLLPVTGAPAELISHWLLLENWNLPLLWRDEQELITAWLSTRVSTLALRN